MRYLIALILLAGCSADADSSVVKCSSCRQKHERHTTVHHCNKNINAEILRTLEDIDHTLRQIENQQTGKEK